LIYFKAKNWKKVIINKILSKPIIKKMDFWLKVFLVNWFINILLVEWSLYKLKRIIDVDEVRDTKYKAFRRDDVKWFNRLWLYPTCHLAFFKILTTFSMIFFTSSWAVACTKGCDMTKPITGWRRT